MDYESDRDDTQLEDSDGLEITELDENVLSVPVSKSGPESIIRIMYTIPEVSEESSREVTPAPTKYNQVLQTISVTVEDQETGFKEEIFKLNDHQTSQIAHSTLEKPTSIKASQSNKEVNGVTVNGEVQKFNDDCNKLQLPVTENKTDSAATKLIELA